MDIVILTSGIKEVMNTLFT